MASRFIIAACHLLLLADALILGFLTYASEIHLPASLIFILGNLFFLSYFLYPRKGQRSGIFKHSYFRQKTSDFLLALTYPLVIATAINVWAFAPDSGQEAPGAKAVLIVNRIHPEIEQKSKKDLKAELKVEFRKSKKQIKAKLKALKKDFRAKKGKDKSNLEKILLVMLVLLGACALAYGVAALACSISCSGQEALAIILAILGLAGIIWLSVLAIKSIFRKRV